MLLAAILVGILAGLAVLRLTAKDTSKNIVRWGDSQLLGYQIPALLFLLGTKFELGHESLRVTALMAAAMIFTLVIATQIAKRILKVDGEMRNGFLVLATCTNTGHGVMLLAASAAASSVVGLAMGPMYMGFLMVIFLPMFLVNRSAVGGFVLEMVLWHPVSYMTWSGVLFSINPAYAWIYLLVIGVRLFYVRFVHEDENAKNTAGLPYILALVLLSLTVHFQNYWEYQFVAQYYPHAMVFLTCITIGIKMGAPMKISHWKMVAWINLFGIVIAPTVGLILAKTIGCSYEEAYVLCYSLSQPPAYLGMLWLRQGKFGKDFAISEWAFVIQALLAYAQAFLIPYVVGYIF